MSSNVIRSIVLIGFLCFGSNAFSSGGILERVISVEINSTPIYRILEVIEKRAEIRFSYNSDLIEEDKIVSLNMVNKTIREGLMRIFDGTVRFKEVGNFIVLLKKEDVAQLKSNKREDLVITYSGVITDAKTKKVIANASIYDVESRYAAISDKNGRYILEIPLIEEVRSLYVKKKGYEAAVFVVDLTGEIGFTKDVALMPIPENIEKLPTQSPERIYLPLEEKVISGALVSPDLYVHSENLEEIKESRMAQIALVPSVSIGSNLSTNGLIINHFSLNILAGYSNGVAGVEIGGLLNMNKGNVKYVQLGGIGNIVGGSVLGLQVGGIFTTVRNDVRGVQLGGISSIIGDHLVGCQFNGISGLVHKTMTGAQFSGIASFTKGSLVGLQMGGIYSAARSGFKGAQISGIASMSDSLSYGLQAAGIWNAHFGTHNGGQFAGIGNFARKGTQFLQLAGIFNFSGTNSGLQAGGLFNYSNQNNGLQVGLINLSNSSRGVALGLLNFVKTGYHKTEIGANELLFANVVFKSGVRPFYNTYNFGFGIRNNVKYYAAGLGFGTSWALAEKWGVNADISGQLVFEENAPSFQFAQLYKFSPTVDYQIKPWLAFFAGPSVNANGMVFPDAEGNYTSDLAVNPFYSDVVSNTLWQVWLGGRIGIRL